MKMIDRFSNGYVLALGLLLAGTGLFSDAKARTSLADLQSQINDVRNGEATMTPLVGDTVTDCIPTYEGLTRYNADSRALQVCNGDAWVDVGGGASGSGSESAFTLMLGGSAPLSSDFYRDIYTCGPSHVVHVEAAISHWSIPFRAVVDAYLWMDPYTNISADTVLDKGTADAGYWTFERLETGHNGFDSTSNVLRIRHTAGSYNGEGKYYILVKSTCDVFEIQE